MLVKEAICITGGLSDPDKMPCKAWGIPAARCKRGSKLRKSKGTVCSLCYACVRAYSWKTVQYAYEHRYYRYMSAIKEVWIEAMATDIASKCKKIPWFRWFDSGDLQSVKMLEDILAVCRKVPQVSCWMSTRERAIVKQGSVVPKNLVIRVSADMIGGPPPEGFAHTSTVSSVHSLSDWRTLVESGTLDNWYCPAPLQDNRCGECRACWDPAVRNTTYRQH